MANFASIGRVDLVHLLLFYVSLGSLTHCNYHSLVSDGARAQSRGQPVIFPRADQGENPGGDPAAEVWLRPVERGQWIDSRYDS